MASTTEQQLTALMRSGRFRQKLSSHLSTADLCAMRCASSAMCNLLTKDLFTRVHVSFTATTFTKQARLEALSRVGHHVEHLTFFMPHGEATFLPPLIHPETGREVNFLYTPHTSVGSALTRRKYANSDLGDMLTQQYPPLFHAATNVPSFIAALQSLPALRHLTVHCPGQHPAERYRRGCVDYALISLRIALERAPLDRLVKLSLADVHPGAFHYLRHVQGFGCVPSAARRWRQIRKLHISVPAWDFHGPAPGPDHLKMMDDYIRHLSPHLEKLSFTWLTRKGPCPLSLAADTVFGLGSPSSSRCSSSSPTGSPSRKLFHEVTSPMSPLPSTPPRPPMHFPSLRYLQLRNVAMNAPQLKGLIASHKDTVREFDLASVALVSASDWDDALSPLDNDDSWWRSSTISPQSMPSPAPSISQYSLVTADSEDDMPLPSAAVEAASRELLDLELGGGISSVLLDEIRGVPADDHLPFPVAAQDDDTASISTNLKRRRIRRRRRRHHDDVHVKPSTPTPVPHPSPPRSTRSKKSPHKTPSSSSIRSARPATPPPTPPPEHDISAPLLNPEPHPVLLQPTVYDPQLRRRAGGGPASADEEISAVQRNLEQEEAHRRLAEDADARVTALRRAKAAVLNKLSREFGGASSSSSSLKSSGSRRGDRGRQSSSSNAGFAGRTADAVAACRLMAGRDFGRCAGIEVVEDRRTLESQSALVPLMFSRG